MADIQVVTLGVQGPAGPASLSAASVITARGALAVGNAAGTPVALAIGAAGRYLRSDGTDPSWAVIAAADLPSAIDAAKIGSGNVSNGEWEFLNGVTSAIQTQLDARSLLTHTHLATDTRGLYFAQSSQSSATPTDNTASTTVYATARDLTVTLPTGTWTVRGIGGVLLNHSASGTVLARVSVNGADTTGRSFSSTSSTLYTPVIDEDSGTGLSGTIHVYIQFRSSTAGTTFAKNPWLFVIAERTA